MGATEINIVVSVACLAAAGVLALRSLRRCRVGRDQETMTHPSNDGFLFGRFTPLLAAMLPEGAEKRSVMHRELINAGYYRASAPSNLAAIRYLGIVVPIVLFGVLLVVVPRALELPILAIGVVVSILGWAMPALWVRSRAADRRDEITRALPDMLDMLNMCVSQGMTFMASLSRVIPELRPVYPALAYELQIVSEQAHIGSVEQALENFANRVATPEVHSFTSMLIQTEQLGTSVSAALAHHSDNMRESRKQRADQAANTAVLKMMFPISLCLMPAVFLFLLGPALVDLTEFFGGEAGAAFRSGRITATQTLEENGIRP